MDQQETNNSRTPLHENYSAPLTSLLIPRTSSTTSITEAASSAPLICIGAGSFGRIFTTPPLILPDVPLSSPTTIVTSTTTTFSSILKRTIIPQHDPNTWLYSDYHWHREIHTAFAHESHISAGTLPLVPRPVAYIPASNTDFWSENAFATRRWPKINGEDCTEGYDVQDQVLIAEWIPSVNEAVKKGITRYALQQQGVDTLTSEGSITMKHSVEAACNKDVLLRVYAGKEEGKRENPDDRPDRLRRRKQFVNLRNYGMGLYMLRELLGEEQLERVIRLIAKALAIMHWVVGCDARDVEFVFGGLPADSDDAGGVGNVFELFGEKVALWLLDFNQVSAIMTTNRERELPIRDVDLDKMAKGYIDNDLYYPRPSQVMKWRWFSEEYLRTAVEVMLPWMYGGMGESRAAIYLERVEDECARLTRLKEAAVTAETSSNGDS